MADSAGESGDSLKVGADNFGPRPVGLAYAATDLFIVRKSEPVWGFGHDWLFLAAVHASARPSRAPCALPLMV